MVETKEAIRQQTARLIEGLTQNLYERDEAVTLALLSAVAGESIFLLGPPGVGKSLVARRLKYAFRDGKSFEYLMSRFSTPDEVFGPVSIKKLKEEDRYERLTENYLPGANIVFLDEIWKAGPAIQNALLTIVNEKVYRNGEQEIQVNINAIVTASNELPPRDKSLDPLWDRFLVRYEMGGIRGRRNFLDMITNTEDVYVDSVPEDAKISTDDLGTWSKRIDEIEVPPEVQNTLQVVKHKIEQYNQRPATEIALEIYDRRWKKIVRLLRTSAFLNGRAKVDLMDCFLMVPCLWNRPEHIEPLQEIVAGTIRDHGYTLAVNLNGLRREIEAFETDVEAETRIKRSVTEARPLAVADEYYELLDSNKPFEGDLLRIAEFDKLDREEFAVVNIYDRDQNLLRRLKTRIGGVENTVDINFNGVEHNIPLRTKSVEREEVTLKKPHRLVAQYWTEQAERLEAYLLEQRRRVSDEQPEEIARLEQNFFVDARQAEIVRANLAEVANALDQLRLRLDKARHAYESL